MAFDPIIAELGTQNVFLRDCTHETRGAILKVADMQRFGRDELLFEEGGDAGVVFFLLSGTLQMSKTATRGRRQVMCDVDPATCGGICLLMLASPGSADVRSSLPGSLLAISRKNFQCLARQDPSLCESAWDSAAECMSHFSNLVESLSFRKVAERVAESLLNSTVTDGDMVRWTQAELAAEVGTTREVVARCLAGLQTEGAIRLGRGRITVLSRSKLLEERAS